MQTPTHQTTTHTNTCPAVKKRSYPSLSITTTRRLEKARARMAEEEELVSPSPPTTPAPSSQDFIIVTTPCSNKRRMVSVTHDDAEQADDMCEHKSDEEQLACKLGEIRELNARASLLQAQVQELDEKLCNAPFIVHARKVAEAMELMDLQFQKMCRQRIDPPTGLITDACCSCLDVLFTPPVFALIEKYGLPSQINALHLIELECHHLLCTYCIIKIGIGKPCPMCRAPIDLMQ